MWQITRGRPAARVVSLSVFRTAVLTLSPEKSQGRGLAGLARAEREQAEQSP
jgi:hypothetical protein